MSLITPEGLLSYPKLFKSELPKDARPTDKKAWSTAILFTAEATKTPEYVALMAEAFKALVDRWGPSVKREIQVVAQGREKGRAFVTCEENGKEKVLYIPIRRDVAAAGYPETVAAFFSARKVDDPDKNIRPPEVISRSGQPITEQREIYPGVRARISVSVFTYDNQGNAGVSFGLNNVQKLGDADRLDNAKAAKDEFGTLPDEPPASMKDELAGFID